MEASTQKLATRFAIDTAVSRYYLDTRVIYKVPQHLERTASPRASERFA